MTPLKQSMSVACTGAFLLGFLATTGFAQVASPEADPDALRPLHDPVAIPPMPLPEPDPDSDTGDQELVRPQFGSAGRGSPAEPPEAGIELPPLDLDEWLENERDHGDLGDSGELSEFVGPLATAANGWPFSTSRVFPREQLLSFPYTTVGRITGRDPVTGGSFSCSGAVIQLRLVLTAGHCVYDAEGGYWYTDWTFHPQYHDGLSPQGAWSVRQAWTTNQWVRGGGRLPNAGDFGILILFDRVIGAQTRSIGTMTGWLGWQTQRFAEHFTQLGYPGNLDGGQRPQETNAQVRAIRAVDYRWGTNQLNGSSGGPLVMNFGENAVGQAFNPNRVVGVVSFGSTAGGYAGSSKLSTSFVRLVRAGCNAQPGNCR